MSTTKKADPATLAAFLSKPRSAAEIAKELKVPGLTEEKVRKLALPATHALFEQKDTTNASIFLAAPRPLDKTVKPRDWALWRASKDVPYLWIQFPMDLKVPRLKIVPLSDVHYGARAHNRKRFGEYLKWIESQSDVYTFLNGDIIENAIDGSIGGAVYESILTPDEQIWGSYDGKEPGIIELLRPIAHKVLWAQPGNHEWRTWKKTNLDPLKVICRELGIPYYSEPIFADVLVWGHRFTFHCHHGTTGSNTKGGKMNAAGRPAEYQEAVDFEIMGHVHDSMANPVTRIVRRREFDAKGQLIGFRLEERAQYTVICPSFHGYFGSYGSRAGYAPGSWGSVSCTLYKDGKYRASE
ncbi:MAG TPA: hypothetical protein VL426_02240 [Candidatus Binatia bacterium]|jgi:hypothetical protein|nr:hypothetical protein [Candidatus Binatia bacterium]